MKRLTPYILILAIGVLSLTIAASNAEAQRTPCQHLHQLSKLLRDQNITPLQCKLCVCEKMEIFFVKHRIQASFVSECYCDETNDVQCDKFHQHTNSGDGDFEGWGCVWSAFDDPNGGAIIPPDAAFFQSAGISDDCIFDATISRWVKYCKNNDSTENPQGNAWPRAGYHSGTWKLLCGTQRIARGRLQGVDGVDPSYSRSSPEGYNVQERSDHATLPGGQDNQGVAIADACDGENCYLAGWQVGCIKGRANDFFFRRHCPPTGTYDLDEIANIADCPGGNLFVINDFRGKQICVTPTETWKIRACYSGGNAIDPSQNPCDQWNGNWAVRLEGVIAIKANNCIQ